MESENPLIQKLRGLLPEKTIPFLVTDLCNQLETAIQVAETVKEEDKQKSLKDLQPDEILSAHIDDRFYTRDDNDFKPTELSLYLTDSAASIFISKEMGHGVGLGYHEAHSQVISRVLAAGSKYKPIYRRIEISIDRDLKKVEFYCLMGAAIPKPISDQAAE